MRNLQVQRRRALSNPTRCVIMGAVARAVIAAIIASVGYGDTTQVSADSDEDGPLRFLHPVEVVLWVPQFAQFDGGLLLDLLGRPVTDEQRLASPFEAHVFALWDLRQLHFDLRHGQDVGGGAHAGDELGDYALGDVGRGDCGNAGDQVRVSLPGFIAGLRGLGAVGDF